ncbi:hydrolase [Actinobacteria bacterium YIM 96077]|uniref:Hydrolase n=1 Tax=Phytoactinopolyspora halophila TaxID=1981511 RepID=A0A329R4L8_9ACTN|nr:hydrolase [Actinobacteria bacterium YIM 96077]RAW18969.1 hydrolase [Phytoactinopolyspora halophila]
MWIDDADDPRLRLVLGHGAGGGVDARDLTALAAALPAVGISVVRVEQPWHVAGKRLAPRPDTLDRAWLAALEAVPGDVPIIAGGRSAGARVACRTARSVGAVAVVALAFPLHPPGKPERSRAAELLGAGVPTLVVQGARDTFGRPDEFPADAPGGHGPADDGSATSEASVPSVVEVPGADHGMAVSKAYDQDKALAMVAGTVREFVEPFAG